MGLIMASHSNSITAGGRTPTASSVIAEEEPAAPVGFALMDEGSRLPREDVDCVTRYSSECIVHAPLVAGSPFSARAFC
jgi:hypothetical protein